MAQTDARPGFRLPWNSERSTTEDTDIDETANADETAQADNADETAQADNADGAGWPTTSDQAVAETSEVAEATAAGDVADAGPPDATEASTPAAGPGPRRPSKFMEDLTKAMQAAAEDARTRTLGQFQTDAKGHIEEIHARSATQAADLRKTADDDVAGIRDWSKAEIARVREETERKITGRKSQLESEIEMQGAQIEREVQVVQDRVAEFEAEMAAFFERLLVEDDPASIASMAERLPEPPPFDTVTESAAAILAQAPAEEVFLDQVATDEAVTDESPAEEAAVEETTGEATAETATETPSDEAEAAAVQDGDATPVAEAVEGEGVPADFEMDREAAFAAVQAAAEAAASAEVATDAANRAETVAEIAMGIGGAHDGEGNATPDFGAAEVEAAADVDGEGDGGEIPVIGDDALAARLAGLVPAAGKASAKVHSGEATSTQVVVVGLVSVASIASFKRHLGRISGVQSVGVSSGPDGEFMFAVHHSADINLRDAIPSLPSFQARVTNATDGVLQVTAHDPESNR
jgi:hypothetical protein